jgi:hypothetical protein
MGVRMGQDTRGASGRHESKEDTTAAFEDQKLGHRPDCLPNVPSKVCVQWLCRWKGQE